MNILLRKEVANPSIHTHDACPHPCPRPVPPAKALCFSRPFPPPPPSRQAALGDDFEVLEEGSMPLVIREHARKYQLLTAHKLVLRRKA